MSEEINDYIVYEVRRNNIPIYIGSGKKGREEHVKSGSSHNPELNKLFFTVPHELVVTIIREGLSKEESLEMEKSYIQAISPELNIVYTNKHSKAIIDGRKKRNRSKSYRSNGK
jgi:hypothetical protein